MFGAQTIFNQYCRGEIVKYFAVFRFRTTRNTSIYLISKTMIRRQTKRRKRRFSPVKLIWKNFWKKGQTSNETDEKNWQFVDYKIVLWRKKPISLVRWNRAFVRTTFFVRTCVLMCGKGVNVFVKVWPTCDIRWKFYHKKNKYLFV